MSAADPTFFKKVTISEEETHNFLKNALRDLEIAKHDTYVEVRLTYGYQALIKAGITIIAHKKNWKVKSVPGHHIKIIETMAELLKLPEINAIGNQMRTKRNLDLYEGGTFVSESQLNAWLDFVEEVLKKVQAQISTK